ncbi:MAG: hypothetical protein MZV64_23960 [Ignavibacteriales bacterium]|nr:hypothetical protein [Ignavibacteriales bacterium]
MPGMELRDVDTAGIHRAGIRPADRGAGSRPGRKPRLGAALDDDGMRFRKGRCRAQGETMPPGTGALEQLRTKGGVMAGSSGPGQRAVGQAGGARGSSGSCSNGWIGRPWKDWKRLHELLL